MYMFRIQVIAIACVLAGCSSTYKQEVVTAPTSALTAGSSVVIAIPANGSYNGRVYVSSGSATTDALRSAFARHTNNIVISTDCKDIGCFKGAKGVHYDYYVVPQILHWEDRATEWSGKKDKLEIKLTVYNGTDWTEVSNFVVSGKSKWATFGGDHPEDLLAAPIDGFVSTLYD